MERENKKYRTAKRVALVLIVGFAAAALSYRLDEASRQGCEFLHMGGWVVLEILRPVLAAGWQTVQAYLTDNAGCLERLPHIVASIGPMLSGLVG